MADHFYNTASVNVPSTCSSVTVTTALSSRTNSLLTVSRNSNVHNYGRQDIMWQPGSSGTPVYLVSRNSNVHNYGRQDIMWQPGSSGTPVYLLQNPQAQSTYPNVWSMHGGSSQFIIGGRVATAQTLQTAVVPNAQLPQFTRVQSRADIHICTMARQNKHLQQPAAIPVVGMQTQSSNYYYTSVLGQYPVNNSALYINNQLHHMQMSRAQIGSFSQTPTVLPTISSVGSSMLQNPVKQKDMTLLLKEIQPGQCARTSGYMLPPSAAQQLQMTEHPNTLGIQHQTHSGLGRAHLMPLNQSIVKLSNLSQSQQVMNTTSHIPGQMPLIRSEIPVYHHQLAITGQVQPTSGFISKNNEKIKLEKGTKVPQSESKNPPVSRKERRKELRKAQAAKVAASKIKIKTKTKASKSSTINKSEPLSKDTQLEGNQDKTTKQLKTASHPGDHIFNKTSKHSGQNINSLVDTILSADSKSDLLMEKPKKKGRENKLSINSSQSARKPKSKTNMPSFKDAQERSSKMCATSNVAGNTYVSTSYVYHKPLQQLEVSIHIPPEKRAEREAMKRKAQLEREEAAKYTSKGRLKFSFDTQEQHAIAYSFRYAF